MNRFVDDPCGSTISHAVQCTSTPLPPSPPCSHGGQSVQLKRGSLPTARWGVGGEGGKVEGDW